MLCRVVVSVTLLGIVAASTGHSPLELKPEKYKDVPGCFIRTLDKVVPLGKEETSSDCVQYRCEDNWYDFYTCDIKMDAPDCRPVVGSARTKPYPDCCPVLECPD